MKNGYTMVTTLKSIAIRVIQEDKKLHMLPLYVLDSTETDIEKKI